MKAYGRELAATRMVWLNALLAAMVAMTLGGCPPAEPPPDDGGQQTVVNVAPMLTFLKPSVDVTAYVSQTVEISWHDEDPDDNATIYLYYDVDGLGGSGDEVLLTVRREDPDGASDTFAWDTTGVPPGTYQILAVVSDGVNPSVTVYSPNQVTLLSPAPVLTLTNPAAATNVKPAQNVVIKWTYLAPLADSTLTLFYDNDRNRANGTRGTIATLTMLPDESDGTYVWNVPAIPAGTYYVGGTLDDGTHAPVTSYADGPVNVTPPDLRVLNPSAVTVLRGEGTIQVKWEDDKGGVAATIRIFYDTDGVADSGDEVLLTTLSEPASQTGGLWSGTFPALPVGTYRLGVELDDGLNAPVVAYATGEVEVAGPALTFTQPSGPLTRSGGDNVTISWVALAGSSSVTVTIFYDTDTNYANGGYVQIVPWQGVPNPLGDSTPWSVPAAAVGTYYYVGGTLDDGRNPVVVAYATGSVTFQGPQIVLTDPAGAISILPGDPVTIAWSNRIPGSNPTIDFFYDTDTDETNGVAGTIDTDVAVNPSAVGGTYVWTTPTSFAGGPYYIGATVDDGLNAPVTGYAPGTVTAMDRNFFSRSLEGVESLGLGRTFRGLAPNGQLGGVMAHVPWVRQKTDPKDASGGTVMRQPGISTNGSNEGGTSLTFDDFVLVAPNATPYYLERPGAGEAYLILSNPSILFTAPAVGNFEPIYVTATGSSLLPGAIFAGPAVTSGGTNEGIGAVAMSRSADADAIPELVFGIPYASKIVQEEQDYDTWDYWVYDFESSLNLQLLNNFTAAMQDVFRVPTLMTQTYTDGNELSRANTAWSTITAGMIVAVAGSNSSIATPLGSAQPQQTLFPLDNVGQVSSEPHPRVVRSSYTSGYQTLTGPTGLRYYCPWWVGLYGTPQYHQYQRLSISAVSDQDNSRFGRSLTEADLDGDGQPEWIGVQPYHQDSGPPLAAGQPGYLHIVWTANSQLWGVTLDALSLQGQGQVRITQVNRTATGDTRGTTSVSTSPTIPTAPALAPICQRVYSWPYAVSYGSWIADFVTDTSVQGTTSYYYENITNTRDRRYIWPMVSDSLQGENGGVLTCLANAGDFSKDGREDITVGAPNLNSNVGATYLVFGMAQYGDLGLPDIAAGTLAGMKIRGTAGSLLGTAQATAGDFNGDGIPDWIIGAPGYNGNQGVAAIVYGSRYKQGVFDLADIGTAKLPGVILTGETAGDQAGKDVAGVGDVDGDGYDDVAIAAPGASFTFADSTTRTDCGIVYLIYGGPSYTGTISLADATKGNLPGKVYVGPHDNDQISKVAPAGDVNDDGLADFLIGNPNANVLDPLGNVIVAKTGEVYLVRGSGRMAP